jgi:hypothetical protein
MALVDRFTTKDRRKVRRAGDAMRNGRVFRCVVNRPECAPEHRRQHWRGAVLSIASGASGFTIEVYRTDI